MSKIFIYAICKNEENNVQTFLENLKKVDGAIVLDTGSTDNTVKLLREAGVAVFEKLYCDFSFSDARNDCLKLVPEDIEWCLSLDFNETIVDDLNELQKIKLNTDYDCYKVLCLGNENKIKIHKRNLYHWKHAVHEQLVANNEQYKTSNSSIVFSKQRVVTEQKLNFYHKICMKEYEKTKDIYFLWFICLYYYQKNISDIFFNFAGEYLDLSIPYNSSFRIYLFLMMAKICKLSGRKKDCTSFILNALSESTYLDRFVTPANGEPPFYEYCLNFIKEENIKIEIG